MALNFKVIKVISSKYLSYIDKKKNILMSDFQINI